MSAMAVERDTRFRWSRIVQWHRVFCLREVTEIRVGRWRCPGCGELIDGAPA